MDRTGVSGERVTLECVSVEGQIGAVNTELAAVQRVGSMCIELAKRYNVAVAEVQRLTKEVAELKSGKGVASPQGRKRR